MRRWYGEPLPHLLGVVACLAVAGYAAVRLVPPNPSGVLSWFVGSALVHDLVLVPLYVAAGSGLVAAGRFLGRRSPVPVANHLRVPAALSGLALLVWFPLILGRPTGFTGITARSVDVYLDRWLLVVAACFGASGVVLVARLVGRRGRRPAAEAPE